MTDGLLDSIIELENEIQAEVSAEQIRAGEWQARELAGLQDDCAKARVDEDLRCRELLADKHVKLKEEGASLEAVAGAWCQRLSKLNDEMLLDVLKRHLAVILPGGDYDHPHGQS
jgi:hypothetical protein